MGERSGFYSLFSERQVARMEQEYEEAGLIHVLSSYAKNSFTEFGFDTEKIHITNFGVDTEKFLPAHTDEERKHFRILYVGRLELLKGIQYLLDAFTQLKSKGIGLQLVGPIQAEILPVLKRFQDDRIEVLGPVSKDELTAIYQNSDLLVFPSINDAFGLVVLEAMACGIPVITTENSCGYDVVSDEIDGFVVPIRSSKHLRDRIEFFLDDREKTREMGKAARQKIQTSFTLAGYQSAYLKFCRDRIERHQ